jgi:spore coat protein CotF
MTTSQQKYHNQFCEVKGPCPTEKIKWSAAEPNNESVIVNVTPPIQHTKKKSFRNGVTGGRQENLKTQKRNVNVQDLNINEINAKTMSAERKTPLSTVSASVKTNGEDTQQTENALEPRSTSAVAEIIQPTASPNSSMDINQVLSESMNLLKNSGNHLYSRMLGLTQTEGNPEVRLVDVERVQATIQCAHGIKEIVKTMNDLIKTAKGLE